MSARHGGLLALLAALWGSSYLLIKYGLDGFSPAGIVFARAALGAVVLVAACRWQGGATWAGLRACARRPLLALGLGTIAIAIPFELISFGERVVPSGLTAVLIAPAPLFVGLFAPRLDRREQLRRAQWLGLVVGLAGVALLVGVESVKGIAEALGALAMLGAALAYALSSFVVRNAFEGVPPLATSAAATIAASLVTFVPAVATLPSAAPDAGAVGAVLALGVAHTGLAFAIFYTLIAAVGAGRAALVSYLTPPFALAWGAVLLGEGIGPTTIVGLVLILGGVALAARHRAPVVEAAGVVAAE